MHKEIESVFASLPPRFYGQVEVFFKNGVPGIVKVTETKQLSTINGANRDDDSRRD